MKRTLLAALFVTSLAALPSEAASITLSGPTSVLAGSAFDLTVNVSDVFAGRDPLDALLGFGFSVTVGNSATLSYTGETIGALFDDFSAAFGGNPAVAGLAAGPNFFLAPGNFAEPLTLATLHFLSLAEGTSTVSVSYDSQDLNQGLIYLNLPYEPLTAATAITAITPTPEPASFALLLAGLVALLATNKREFTRRP